MWFFYTIIRKFDQFGLKSEFVMSFFVILTENLVSMVVKAFDLFYWKRLNDMQHEIRKKEQIFLFTMSKSQ